MAKTPTFNESVPVINDNNIRKFAIILAQKSQQAIHIRVGLFEGSLKQCRSKGNISGGAREPESRAARGVWGHAPPENFEI